MATEEKLTYILYNYLQCGFTINQMYFMQLQIENLKKYIKSEKLKSNNEKEKWNEYCQKAKLHTNSLVATNAQGYMNWESVHPRSCRPQRMKQDLFILW